MIEMICEFARMTTRKGYRRNKYVSLKNTKKAVEVRPIEKSIRTGTNETGSGRNTGDLHLGDSEIFLTKYDKHGKVVLGLPNKRTPFGKIV